MKLEDYRDAAATLPIGTFPASTWALLAAIEAAWADAEAGIPSEAESRRWSPVCDEALRIVTQAAVA